MPFISLIPIEHPLIEYLKMLNYLNGLAVGIPKAKVVAALKRGLFC
jgi:hypothetical protein